ncbi:MAG: sensor histidine kinase [Clostridium sp.]|jgi:two-component system, LytTR family, sensor histidine kinase AgrC
MINMINNPIDFIFTFFESALVYWLMYNLFSFRSLNVQKILLLLATILGSSLFAYYLSNEPIIIRFILYIVVFLGAIQIFFSGKWYAELFFLLVANYIFLISDILQGNLFSYLAKVNILKVINMPSTLFELAVLTKLLNVALFLICINYFSKFDFEIPKKYWIIMDVVVFLFAIILQFIMEISPILQTDSVLYSINICGISLGFLVVFWLVVYFFAEICLFYIKEKKHYILKIRNHSLRQEVAYYKSTTSNLNKIRHDINNNLSIISYLLKQNNLSKSISYIDTMIKNIQNPDPIINCGNDILDAIVNYKIAICKQHHIHVKVKVDQVPQLHISSMDLTAILANIFDNAIEALDAVQEEKRYLFGKIFCYKNYIAIVFKNPYSSSIVLDKGKIKTHKSDKVHHGYGLASIESSTAKYGGSCKFYYDKNVFKVVVMLPLKIKDECNRNLPFGSI